MQQPDVALLDYDTAIDWLERLEREGPFLRSALAATPNRRVIDLGSGTGEHARWLAGEGFEVVAIEGAKERWEAARARPMAQVQHVIGDLGAVEQLVRGHFGAAVCLGNTLPSLVGVEALSRLLIGLRRRLLPGGVFVAQQLDYDALGDDGTVSLPERRIPREGGDLVFRRQLALRPDGVVEVTDRTLWQAPASAAGELLRQRQYFQQGWRHTQLETLLDVAGFAEVELFGGFGGEPFDPAASPELVLRAS